MSSNAERCCLLEENAFQRLRKLRRCDHTQQDARPFLFHLDRRAEDIERSRVEELLFGITDDFSADIVQVRFQQHDDVAIRCRLDGADEHPQ